MRNRPADTGLSKALGDRYRLERELGRGGMATVYFTRDLRHERPVALKVLHPELGAILGAERFLREIRLTAQLVRVLAFAGNEARALRELREALELEPESESLYHHWAVMLLHRGQRDSAVAVLDRHVHTPTWYNGWLYAAAGRREKGQQMLDSLLVLSQSRPVDPAHIAALEAGLGNTEEALNWLERAYAERSQLLLLLLGPHPAFDGLRGNQRFRELRAKAGFKQ